MSSNRRCRENTKIMNQNDEEGVETTTTTKKHRNKNHLILDENHYHSID